MNKEVIDTIDSFIKKISSRISNLEDNDKSSSVALNMGNIQHNYELIYELKDELREIKQEIDKLKMFLIRLNKLQNIK